MQPDDGTFYHGNTSYSHTSQNYIRKFSFSDDDAFSGGSWASQLRVGAGSPAGDLRLGRPSYHHPSTSSTNSPSPCTTTITTPSSPTTTTTITALPTAYTATDPVYLPGLHTVSSPSTTGLYPPSSSTSYSTAPSTIPLTLTQSGVNNNNNDNLQTFCHNTNQLPSVETLISVGSGNNPIEHPHTLPGHVSYLEAGGDHLASSDDPYHHQTSPDSCILSPQNFNTQQHFVYNNLPQPSNFYTEQTNFLPVFDPASVSSTAGKQDAGDQHQHLHHQQQHPTYTTQIPGFTSTTSPASNTWASPPPTCEGQRTEIPSSSGIIPATCCSGTSYTNLDPLTMTVVKPEPGDHARTLPTPAGHSSCMDRYIPPPPLPAHPAASSSWGSPSSSDSSQYTGELCSPGGGGSGGGGLVIDATPSTSTGVGGMGLPEPGTSTSPSKKPHPRQGYRRASDGDPRKERRREQNRRAALKCRVKKKREWDAVQEDYNRLETSNAEMEAKIAKLRREKNELVELLRQHKETCSLPIDLPQDSP